MACRGCHPRKPVAAERAISRFCSSGVSSNHRLAFESSCDAVLDSVVPLALA